MSNLQVEIVSPKEGVVFEGSCVLVTVPSVEGDLGIMVGHEATTVSLKQGKIKICDENHNPTKTIEVSESGGFAQIESGEKLIVLING